MVNRLTQIYEHIQLTLTLPVKDEGAVEKFFELLDAKLGQCGVTSSMKAVSIADDDNTLRKLDTAITLKQQDVQTFASGLVAERDPTMDQGQSDIQAFYANMIDVTNNPKALSERNRRKQRQKEMVRCCLVRK